MHRETTRPGGGWSQHSSDSLCHRGQARGLRHENKFSPRKSRSRPSSSQRRLRLRKQRETLWLSFTGGKRLGSAGGPLLAGMQPPIPGAFPSLPSFTPTISEPAHHSLAVIEGLMQSVCSDTASRGRQLSSGHSASQNGVFSSPFLGNRTSSVWTHISTARV